MTDAEIQPVAESVHSLLEAYRGDESKQFFFVGKEDGDEGVTMTMRVSVPFLAEILLNIYEQSPDAKRLADTLFEVLVAPKSGGASQPVTFKMAPQEAVKEVANG
jgi:hypothetical protein